MTIAATNPSTIPAFTAALKAALEARTGLKGVSICDGPCPPGDAEREEVIELLDAESDIGAFLDATTQPRKEDGQLKILITVQRATRDKQTQVNERAFELLAEISTQLRQTTDLQGFYTGPGFVAGARLAHITHTKRTAPNNQVREAGLEVTVIWKARI